MRLKEIIFWSVLIGATGMLVAHHYSFHKLSIYQALSTLPYVIVFGCGVGTTFVVAAHTLSWVYNHSPLEWHENFFLFITFTAAVLIMYITGWTQWQIVFWLQNKGI